MTNAEAWFNKSLRPRKPEGSLGRTAQDGHLDSHTAPELWGLIIRQVCFYTGVVWLGSSNTWMNMKHVYAEHTAENQTSGIIRSAYSVTYTCTYRSHIFCVFFQKLHRLLQHWPKLEAPPEAARAVSLARRLTRGLSVADRRHTLVSLRYLKYLHGICVSCEFEDIVDINLNGYLLMGSCTWLHDLVFYARVYRVRMLTSPWPGSLCACVSIVCEY